VTTATGKIAAAIVGVTGYEGVALAHLIANHPYFQLIEAISRAAQGQCIGTALPSLMAAPIASITITETVQSADLVFLTTPHGVSAMMADKFRAEGRRVIDLSADFRLHNPAEYARWYGHEHPAQRWLPEAVYGLCELHREALRAANLAAIPGCFPTVAILSLAPAYAEHLIQPEAIVDAKTGISGAGRSPSRRTHFVETHDSVTAYGLAGHRHLPEMENELSALSDEPAQITFIPHLIPMSRGMLATCYATLRPGITAQQVRAAYAAHYKDEPFVQIIEQPPETGWVRGSNLCMLSLFIDEARRRLIVVGAIDNLMKGGAGQAVQSANIMYGLDETAGLPGEGVWP
jgi:N-acetyl-gamma-glutamyl-phosphate reductase